MQKKIVESHSRALSDELVESKSTILFKTTEECKSRQKFSACRYVLFSRAICAPKPHLISVHLNYKRNIERESESNQNTPTEIPFFENLVTTLKSLDKMEMTYINSSNRINANQCTCCAKLQLRAIQQWKKPIRQPPNVVLQAERAFCLCAY